MRNINIPASFDVSSRGQVFTVDTAKLSDEILAQAIVHGLTQTIGDAASAAAASAYEGKEPNGTPWKELSPQRKKDWSLANALAIMEESAVLMEKRIAALYEGDWQTRKAAAAGLSKFDAYRGELVADKMEFAKGTSKADRVKAGLAKFETLASDTRQKIDKLVQARIDREREEASLSIDLDF